LNKDAFELRQANSTALSMRSAGLHFLPATRAQAERADPRLIDAWQFDSRVDRSRFERRKEAYVKARVGPSAEACTPPNR